jgi:hypothetical protein
MHSVRTQLTKIDVTRAVLSRLTRPAPLLKTWLLWTLIVAVLGIVILTISAASGALLSVALSIAFMLLRVRAALKEGDGVLGVHDYVLTDEGLHERTAVNETLAKWNGIKEVRNAKRFAFIEMRSGAFHIIPLHAFESSEHAAGFLSEVRRRAGNDA